MFGVTLAVSERPVSAAENLDLIVREKARDRSEGRASPDCRCLHLGSSRGYGPARPCSPGIRRDNFHISPRPRAPLLCCLDKGKKKRTRSGHDRTSHTLHRDQRWGLWHLQALRRGLCRTAVTLVPRSVSKGSVHLLLEDMRQGMQWDAAHTGWVVVRAV